MNDTIEDDDTILLHNLDNYHQYLFPWKEFNRWLCYGSARKLIKREFAFTYTDNSFGRFKSFHSSVQLRTYVVHKGVVKMDIGAMYRARPGLSYQDSDILAEPMEKELVFDIDITDYDNARTCCQADTICCKCWKFVATACKIVDAFLREDFGWKLILWVFSGRRGIHCWVCDESVRSMCDEDRKALVSALNLRKDPNSTILLAGKRLSHHVRRSYEIAKDSFLHVCVEEQDILGNDRSIEIFISLLPATCRDEVRALILKVPPGKLRWIKFHIYWTHKKYLGSEVWKKRPHLIEEIILWYMYPRLDTNVTMKMEHLLKAPFTFHPETGGLSTPFDPKTVDEFDIANVPHLSVFVDEVMRMRCGDDVVLLSELSQVASFERSIEVFKNFVKEVDKALGPRYANR